MKPRFKIDLNEHSFNFPFVLFFDTGWLWAKWRRVDSFQTKDEAVNHYHKVKSLPEYLP